MAKLKLGPIDDEKPLRITAELPASVHRDLLAYAEALGRETGQTIQARRLVAPMLARFMATDRGFATTRRKAGSSRDAPLAAEMAVPSSASEPS